MNRALGWHRRATTHDSPSGSPEWHRIDLTRTDAVGVQLLLAYLDFAERGVEALHFEVCEGYYDSPFEYRVARALEREGMSVHHQVGCGGFRIDLALVDPAYPGRYVLGIECDGATYQQLGHGPGSRPAPPAGP